MEWKVVNALSRDVERQQLNAILAEIRKVVDTPAPTSDISATIGRVVSTGSKSGITVTYDSQNKVVDFTVAAGVVSTPPVVTSTGIEDAPVDNQSYVRLNGDWGLLTIVNESASLGETRRRVSMGW